MEFQKDGIDLISGVGKDIVPIHKNSQHTSPQIQNIQGREMCFH